MVFHKLVTHVVQNLLERTYKNYAFLNSWWSMLGDWAGLERRSVGNKTGLMDLELACCRKRKAFDLMFSAAIVGLKWTHIMLLY